MNFLTQIYGPHIPNLIQINHEANVSQNCSKINEEEIMRNRE